MSSVSLQILFIFTLVNCNYIYSFVIPLPFGGIDINRGANGQVGVNTFSGFNILGNGFNSGFNVEAGNGTLKLQRK